MESFVTATGVRIFRLPLRVFPTLVGYAHLLIGREGVLLVDVGSGLPDSNADLLQGFEEVSRELGRSLTLNDVDVILISHGHIDHFGGLPFVRQHTQAPVYVHALDRRVLSRFEERTTLATRDLDLWLRRAGVRAERRAQLLEMYGFAKTFYRSVPVQGTLDDEDHFVYGDVIHTPGHCPGLVCLRVDDILLVADHVLPRTSPHLSPERITRYTGLGHYLESLRKLEHHLEGIRLALGGHEEPMEDVKARIEGIRASHREKLRHILAICRTPHTIAEISKLRYHRRHGYDVLLALTETGAHVEYLYNRGYVRVANLDEVEGDATAPVFYETVEPLR